MSDYCPIIESLTRFYRKPVVNVKERTKPKHHNLHSLVESEEKELNKSQGIICYQDVNHTKDCLRLVTLVKLSTVCRAFSLINSQPAR